MCRELIEARSEKTLSILSSGYGKADVLLLQVPRVPAEEMGYWGVGGAQGGGAEGL